MKYTGEIVSRWLPEVLGWVIPLLLLVALWSFFFRRMGGAEGGVMSFARSRAKIYADDDVKVSFADVAGVDEAEEELREIVEFLKTPEEIHAARRPHPEGRAARRPPGHGQDAAGARRGRRGQGAVLHPERLGVRRDVRRRRRRARARPVPAGGGQVALHRLHRRARRARQGARAEPDGQPRRARADAEPAAGRDGRLRFEEGRHHHGRDEPAGGARPGAAASGTVRPPGAGGQAGHQRPRGRAEDSRAHGQGRARGRPAHDRQPHGGVCRRRSGQPRQRGGAAGGAQGQDRRRHARLRRGHRSPRSPGSRRSA